MKKLYSLLLATCCVAAAHSQDLHFTRIQDMRSWYNQALQPDRTTTAAFNYRTLDYAGYIAFRTGTAVADVNLQKAAARKEAKGGYATLTAGASMDQTNSKILRNTNAMVGFSYAVPVNAAGNTYAAAGFQGALFQSQTNLVNATFPDQYDNFKLVPGRATNDPYRSGNVNYLSVNAGLSLFHKDAEGSWYAGASVRHLNEPQAGRNAAAGYRLPRTYGAQLGGSRQLTDDQRLSLHAALNWKSEAYEHLVNLQYNAEFPRAGWDRGIGAGVGYRVGDALIPNFEFRLERTVFAFGYDININRMHQTGMRRTSLEASIRHRFQ